MPDEVQGRVCLPATGQGAWPPGGHAAAALAAPGRCPWLWAGPPAASVAGGGGGGSPAPCAPPAAALRGVPGLRAARGCWGEHPGLPPGWQHPPSLPPALADGALAGVRPRGPRSLLSWGHRGVGGQLTRPAVRGLGGERASGRLCAAAAEPGPNQSHPARSWPRPVPGGHTSPLPCPRKAPRGHCPRSCPGSRATSSLLSWGLQWV